MERKPSGESASAKAPPRMRQGRRSRPKSGRNCTAPREIRGRRRRIGSGARFSFSAAFRTARLIADSRKCPQRPVRDVSAPRVFSRRSLKFEVIFQAALAKLPTLCSRLYRKVPPHPNLKSGGDRRFPPHFHSLVEAFFRPELCWAP